MNTPSPVRTYVAGIFAYGKFVSSIDLLDFLIIMIMFRQMRDNQAILLLAVLTGSYVAADYGLQVYSDTTVNAIAVGTEFGFFIFDHVSMVSIFHRLMSLYGDKMQKIGISAFLLTVIGIGAALRIIRCSVRFGTPMFDITGTNTDIGIFINAILGEFSLLALLGYKCFEHRNKVYGKDYDLDVLIQEAYNRIYVRIPLGVVEAIYYILQGQLVLGEAISIGFQFLCFTPIIARHLSGAINGLIILLSKHKSIEKTKTIVSAREYVKSAQGSSANEKTTTSNQAKSGSAMKILK